jgi:hypothetical protein
MLGAGHGGLIMIRTVRRCFCSAFASLCAAALTGCDYDQPVRPVRTVSTKASASHSPQRPPLSTTDLSIPANSAAPLYGGTNLVSTGVVIRNGLNMRLRMGSMVAEHNLAMRIECHFWWVPEGEVNPNGYPINTPPYSLVSYRAASDPGGANIVSKGMFGGVIAPPETGR